MFIEGLHEKELFTEKFPFRLAMNVEYDFEYPSHWHNAVEVVYILEGSYNVNVDGRDLEMQQNDILIIASGELHSLNNYGRRGKRAFFQFGLSGLEGFGDINSVKSLIDRTRFIPADDDKELHDSLELQLRLILEVCEKQEAAYDLYINARILDILVILSRSPLSYAGFGSTAGKSRVFGLERIKNALQYIEDNYQNDITLKEVSRAAGFSEYHFSRIFKQITEKNFQLYLNDLRIKKAEKLLANPNLTIAQVALSSGFNSLVTFNRLFRKNKGCSPSQYKKLHK